MHGEKEMKINKGNDKKEKTNSPYHDPVCHYKPIYQALACNLIRLCFDKTMWRERKEKEKET